MGTIFGRYVFKQAGSAVLLILLSLSGVVWIALALRQLNLVTSKGQDTLMFLKMTTLALPNLMALIAPVALLIAVIHTLNRLNSDSETIVLTASGATVWTIARPLLALAFLVSLAVAFVNHVGMPWSLKLLRESVIQVRTDLISQVLQPGRFSSPETGVTIHIRDRALNGELSGILMHDARNPNQVMSYLAERGVIVKQGDDAYLYMTQGHIVRRPGPKDASQVITFDSYAIDLERFDKKEAVSGLKPRERFTWELLSGEGADEESRRRPGQSVAELHERFSNPLYPFVFVLIALASVGQAQSTRQNRTEAVVIGFVAAAGSRLVALALNNLVVLRPSTWPLLYLLPLMAMGLALLAIARNAKPRKARVRITDRLADGVRAAATGIAARLPSLRGKARPGAAE